MSLSRNKVIFFCWCVILLTTSISFSSQQHHKDATKVSVYTIWYRWFYGTMRRRTKEDDRSPLWLGNESSSTWKRWSIHYTPMSPQRSYYWCYRNPPQTTTEIGRLWSNEGYFGGTVMPCDMGTWNCQRLITNVCEVCRDSLTDFDPPPPMKCLGVDWDDNFDADKRSENINQFTNMPHTGSGDMRSHFSQNLTFREKTSTFENIVFEWCYEKENFDNKSFLFLSRHAD